MKTLRELVEMQKFTNKSDMDLIADWFIENEKESEGINLMNVIAKTKMDKQYMELRKIKSDLSMFAGSEQIFRKFGKETGSRLIHIINLFIAGYSIDVEYPHHFEWLVETIPTLECPKIFWREFYDWLRVKGIYFKGEDFKDGKKN